MPNRVENEEDRSLTGRERTGNHSEAFATSIDKLDRWLERAEWKAYDPFDGLSSPFTKLFTLGVPFLRQCMEQAVRRFPINLRPILLIPPTTSTKAMGFFAQGYLRLYKTRGDEAYREKATFCLQWLLDHPSPGYSGLCWGNHFDHQSRGGLSPRGHPTIVWTSHIGQAFLDAYDLLGDEKYLDAAGSAVQFILTDIPRCDTADSTYFAYGPAESAPSACIHNASVLGAGLMARYQSYTHDKELAELACRTIRFTVDDQLDNGSWYYGTGSMWKWIDSFHTAYNLESIYLYGKHTGDDRFQKSLQRGYDYFIKTFFLEDGTPRYYDYKTPPLDIQCASQGIQTLCNLKELNAGSVDVATRVALWTIENMQDRTGYFYYRKYPWIANKTPTLHWAQATTFAALTILEAELRT